jgi:ketosteroid isomerase-like protein
MRAPERRSLEPLRMIRELAIVVHAPPLVFVLPRSAQWVITYSAQEQRMLHALLIVLTAVRLLSAAPASEDRADVVATIHQFGDAFNRGDGKAAMALCSEHAVIIDEFPPYLWSGTGCAKWMDDYDANAKKNRITDGHVVLGAASHVDFTGNLAYVVMPIDYTFRMKGKPQREIGSLLTIVLEKSATGWQITGWSYSKH